MNKSNRHNLIAILASLIAVVMIFGMAVVLGGDFGAYTSGNESESAGNMFSTSNDTTVEKTAYDNSWTAIGNSTALTKFFTDSQSKTVKGYLSADFTWDVTTCSSDYKFGNSTYKQSILSGIDYYGNQRTLTLNYKGTYNTDQGNTLQSGESDRGGGLIYANYCTIQNWNMVYTGGAVIGGTEGDTSVGILCGYNKGTLRDVTVTIGDNAYFRLKWGGVTKNKAYYLSGIVATNGDGTTKGYMYNCKFVQRSTVDYSLQCQAPKRTAWPNVAYSRIGGVVGENSSSGYIYGAICVIEGNNNSKRWLANDADGNADKRSAGICATNNGYIYGHLIDGADPTSNGATDKFYYNGSAPAAKYFIHAGSCATANESKQLLNSSNFTYYFTGDTDSTVALKLVPNRSWSTDEYIHTVVVGDGSTRDIMLTDGLAVRDYSILCNSITANFGTMTYAYKGYSKFVIVDNSNNVLAEYDATTNYRLSVPYDGKIRTIKARYYSHSGTLLGLSDNLSTNSIVNAGDSASSSIIPGKCFSANNECVIAVAHTMNYSIYEREATIKLPQYIFDKGGANRLKYSLDGTTWKSDIDWFTASSNQEAIKQSIVKNSTAYVAASSGEAFTDTRPSGTNTYESSAVNNSYSKYQQPIVKTTSGTAINSQSTLESWLNGSGNGYLTGDFEIPFGSKSNGSTYAIASGRTLYGNGHTISVSYSYGGWSSNMPSYVGGLFKTNAGTIRDLNYVFTGQLYVDGSNTTWSSPFVGQNTGTIANCVVDYQGNYQVHGTGTNDQWYMLGGVVGENSGTMSNVTFIMNTTTQASNVSNGYVMRCNFRNSVNGMIAGIAGENKSAGYIYGARYVQKSGQLRADLNNSGNTPKNSSVSAICANNNGTIIGQMVEGTPNMYNQYSSSRCRYFAMNGPSGSWTTSGSYCYLIKGATCTERSGITKINVGYSDSVTSYDDVNVYFSNSTSIRVNITLAKAIVDAGNKILQAGTQDYSSQTVYSVYWTTPNSSFGSIRYGKTISSDAIKTEQESNANRGILEADLSSVVNALLEKLALQNSVDFYSGNIGGYSYNTTAISGTKLNSNYNITITTQGNYYIVGTVTVTLQDIYHMQGATVATWTKDTHYTIDEPNITINNAAWLLGGVSYATVIGGYNINQKYSPTVTLGNSGYTNITVTGISNTNILDDIVYKIKTTDTTTAATSATASIYVSKKANSLNVYDFAVSALGSATFVSYDSTGYSFTFNTSILPTGVNYQNFAAAGNPANVVSLTWDATKYYLHITETDMNRYYGAGGTGSGAVNSFDLNLLYLYNATTNDEAALKAFLSGDDSTADKRKFGGAWTLTLTGNVTITSALGSAVIFNQYKTLDGAGHTITINTPTGANYASTNGTTYSTPGYPTNVIGYTNYVYRGGLAAVNCGTIQNVNIVLGGDLGTSTANDKSYAVGGVVGLNQGGSFSNVKVTVNSNQTIGALANPAVWGTLIGISSGGSIHDITIGGDRNKTITNNSGDATYRGYIGGVVGVMNLTDGNTNIGVFMADPNNSSKMFGTIALAKPSAFKNIYNMYMGSYVGTNAFKGLVTGASYKSGATPSNFDIFNNIVYFNKSESAVPFFSLTAGKHDASILSAYGALGQEDETAITLDNKLMKGVGITLKYDSYNDRAGDGSSLEVLDMLDYTISGTSIYFNRANSDIRNLSLAVANSAVSGVTSGNDACVTFNNSYFNATSSAANTNQITAVLTMTLAVTTADGLNDFLKGASASDPLMAIINGIGIESDISISSWDNSTLLKVDAGRTLDGGNYTVTMNLTSTNKAYADYSSSDNWNGYKLVYDFIGVNNGTIQNLKFVGQTGNFSSYDLAVNHIIGSLVAVNNGTINSVTYSNKGIGNYNNSNSANVNTIAGLVAGVNMGAITSTQAFNRALFSVIGMFGGSVGVAMGAIAGVNDGGYAETVKVFGDNAIELVSKTGSNTNTALYVGGVFGVANNYGSLTFAGNSISKATADKAVISNANVIVAGGMGIRYSGGTIMPYGSRGIFAGIATGELGYDTGRQMTGLAFMDMQTNPNLAISYVYDAGVLSYFASDRIFNNSLSNGELTMMGYSNYVQGDSTACVSGGKVDIVDYHGNSIFMYNYDATTNTNSYNGKTFLSGLQNYMNGSADTIEFDVKNVSSYLYVDDPMNMGIVCMSATLGSILTGTVLNYDTAKGLSGFATSTVNNVVSGVTYKYKWAIDPGRDSSNQSNIIQGFIEGKTATSFRAAGAALALTLTTDTEVSFAGLSAGRVLEAGRSINGGGYTLTVNVGSDTLNINEGNASNLYAIEGYDVVGVGGLFSAVQGVISDLNIVVNITGGTINATGTNLAVGGAVGIISGVTSTFGSVQVNVNGTTINFNDGGKTLAFGGAVGAIYNNGSNTSLTLNQNHTNYVYMKGVTMTGNAQNVAIGGAVGLLQGSMLQGGANPTVLYLSSLNRAAGTQGFDVTSTVSFSGTGGLGGLVGIMAGSTLQNINIDQGMSFAGTAPSQYLWTAERDMVWTLNGGSGSAVSAMGGAVGVSFSGNINSVGVNSRARLINNVGTGAGDATGNYIGGLLGLGSNSGDMSLTGTADAYTETINGKTYTLTTTKINNIYAGQIGMIAMPDGGYAGYVTGRYINAIENYGDANNLQNLVWIDFTRKQADLYSKIQVFGATNSAGITLSNVAGMSVLGYVSTDMYNTLTQEGYNKSGNNSNTGKLATYSKITACDFTGTDISIALAAYIVYHTGLAQYSLSIRLIGTLTTGGGGYKPYSTDINATGTEYLRYWTAQIMAADNNTPLDTARTFDSGVLGSQMVYNGLWIYTRYDGSGKHNNLRIQLFRNEVQITTETELQEFISGINFDASVDYTNATAGVLMNNITLRQEPNKFILNKPLYGGGHTITLVTASASDRTNTLSQYVAEYAGNNDAYSYKSGQKLSEAFGVTTEQTPIKDWHAYLYGLFVGYISPSGGIYDVNFGYNQALVVTRHNDDGRYSMAVGIISALNSGTIQNCQLTLGSSTNLIVNRSMPKSENNTYESFKNICIAGGFTAMMIGDTTGSSSNEANMINCTLNMDEKAMIKSIGETHRRANMSNYPHGQTMAGGMIGWMGKNSNLINSTLNGGGLIEARTNMVAWFAQGASDSYRAANFIMQQMYSSGAGALVGVNTQSYYYYGDATSGADNETGNQPYTNVVPIGDNKIRGVIDGVIINWYGFTLESITAKAAEVREGMFLYSDTTYTGGTAGRHGDLQKIGGQSTDLGVSLGYRQIAGICDWEQINNAYLVSRSNSGTTPCAYAGWTAHNVDEDDNWFEAYTVPQGMTVATRYVGRGGEYTAENPAKELYVYDNTDPDHLQLIDKDALGDDANVSLSWAGTGIDAKLSFNFTIADPTAEGKFLWDTQVWQVQPTSSALFNAKPEDAVEATEGDGWTSPSQPNLLFYNDVYDKINNMSDAIYYADVSHTFSRGNNVYLYYSYGTTGSASIDRTRYYYDANTGVYYDKYTTSFGNNFNMPALSFYGSNGAEIPGSSISSTLYRSLEVYNFTGTDPTKPDTEEKITSLTYYDKDKNVVSSDSDNIASVGLNKPVAGSYRISFNTRSEEVSTGGVAIKDIPSKTIIFPDTDIVSGNFKVVEIITPFGLYADEMYLIKEYTGNSGIGTTKIDVQPRTGREDYISANENEIKNISWSNAGLTYKANAIGTCDISITLKDWQYYGYLPTANDGKGGLGYNRTYLINGSGFSLEYDFSDGAINEGIAISGSTATLTGRGRVIPVDTNITYVQKTFNNNTTANGTGVSLNSEANNKVKFANYADKKVGNNKDVTIDNVSLFEYNGNWYDIYRYYGGGFTTGQGIRVSANGTSTADTWVNKATTLQATSLSGTTLTVEGIGTILPAMGTLNYIAKEYDGNKGIKYSQTSGYSTAKISHNVSIIDGTTLQPKAEFGTADVKYSGGNYNDLKLTVAPIHDYVNNKDVYALVDGNDNVYNYGFSNYNSYSNNVCTFTGKGVIIPKTVAITGAKKVYDKTTAFKSSVVTTLSDTDNEAMELTFSPSVTLTDLGISNLAGFATFASAGATYGSAIAINVTANNAFTYPSGSDLSTSYGTRYFASSSVKNYALTARVYNGVGYIAPKKLTWESSGDLKAIIFKTYDNTKAYTGSAAATDYLTGIVSGDTVTPSIKFSGVDVKVAGVGFTIDTTQQSVDSKPYNTIDGGSNYWIASNSATGMILPKAVTFSGITKMYDGTDTITDAIYNSMTTTGSIGNAKLKPVGTFNNRHAGSKTITWASTSSISHGGKTYNLLQDKDSKTSGTDCASNYYVESGTSTGTITPYILSATDFTVSVVQKNGNTEKASQTGKALGFTYFAGAVYVVSATISNKPRQEDDLTAEFSVNGTGSTKNSTNNYSCNAGTYTITAEELGGTDAGNYTWGGAPTALNLGVTMTVAQQEVTNVAITVKPTNKDYGADLPTATASAWSAKDNVTLGEISGLAFSISAYQWIDDSSNAVTTTSPIGGYNLKVTAITMSGNDNYKLAAGATYSVTVTPSGAKALYILPLKTTLGSVEKVYDGTTDFTASTTFKTESSTTSPLGNAFVGSYANKNVQGYNTIAMGNVNIKVITFTYYDNTGAQQTKYVIATGNATTMSNYYLDATVTDGYATLQVGVITPKEVTIGTVSITQSDSRGVVANDTKPAPGNFEYYSTATYSYSATLSGVISGDTVGVSITDPCGGTYNADTYDLTFNGLTGADAGNYTFNGTFSAQLIIEAQTLKNVSVSIKPINVVYGNAIPTTIDGATGSAVDYKSNEGVTANFTISGFSTSATSTSPIGGYDIIIDYGKVSLAGNGNYVIDSTTTITVVVTPAEAKALYIIPADATINSVTKIYDGTTTFTGATIVTTPASVDVKGTYVDKNAGNGKSVYVDVAAFTYYNTLGAEVSVDIFKATNYKVANTHTTNASVATIDGVGVINKYAIKGSEITGVTVTQTWKGTPSTTAPFKYYYTATYVATGAFDLFNAYGDTVTVTLGIYKSTDSGYANVSGTTNVGVGTYKISLLSVSATPDDNFTVDTGAEQYSNTTTFKIDPQVVNNVYVVGNHFATTYTGAPLTYDKSAANFKIYAIDLDDREVNISGGIKENGLTMGVDGQTFATSQTQVGIYNVKVSVNGSAEGNNYTFSAIDNADVYIDQAKTAKTEFAIIPMEATLETAHKTYDGNNTLTGDIVIKFIDANSAAIDFGTATVSATFDSANAGNRKLVFVTKEFAYYPTGTTTKSTLNIIQTSTTTPAEGEGEASVSTTFTNYHIGSSNTVDGVAYIIPKLVDLSSPSKPYDGTTALGGEVSATGTVGGEKISISGSFDDCNAGENIGITINVVDMLLGGVHYNALSGNTNYCIAANNYTGTITPRDIESSHLSLLQLARLDAKDGDKQVALLDIAGSEAANLTDSVEYTSKYKYQGIGGHLYVAADKTAEPNGNWSFKLYQAFAIEQEKGLTFSVTLLDKNGTEVEFAQNRGAYTIKVVFGGGNYKVATITKTFTITQQEVTDAANIYVYMDSFEGVYGQGNFKSPSASGYDYRIGIVDKVSGDIVEFVKGAEGHNFAIGSLAFSKQGGTANTTIAADENGIYIGGYYLFAASVTGESNNFDTSKLDLSAANKKIYGIGTEAKDENQSLYYIIPAELDLTSVTKTYDGKVAFTDGSKDPNNVTEFTYGSGVLAEDRTMRLVGEFSDFNATHNNAGTSGTKGAVKIATEIMSVTTLTTTTNYNIVLKEGGVKTNYYLAIGSAETMIEVADKAIIKKYVITGGAIQLSVQGYEGYLADSENKVTKYINAPTDTIEFTYANGYRYNDKFVITGLQPIAGQGLFNAADDINAMSVVLGPDNISNASDNPYELVVKSFTASNYEWGSNATIGKLKINKQLVNEDSIAISIPPLALEYNGNVQKPEGVDKFSFTVKDFYTGDSAKADGAGGSGVSGIKYYMNSVEVPNPTDIGGYSVSVVVDTSYIDTNNYTMADGVSSITKQADNGNAVFFILPKALTVNSVTKQYDGTANFVDIQVNGVKADSVADPKTIITIDEGGFVKESDKNIVYNAIISKGGYFGSKDIAETVSVVYFTASSFSYRTTVDGVVTGGTAYYIYGTNYMVPSASVGHITPAHITINGMTKTYDGTTALQFEYSYDSNTKVGINKTTESVTGAMRNEVIRPAGEYTSADVTAVDTKIAVKFNVTEMLIAGVTYYRLVNNALDGGESNASNYYIFTSNDSVSVVDGMITIDGIGTIKAIAISDGTTGTTADACISNITIDGKAYDSLTAFIYNYSKSYGIADLKATFKFFGGKLTCQGEYDSTKGLMKVEGIKGDTLYFSITFTEATFAKNAGEYVVKIKLIEIDSTKNNAYEFGTSGTLTLSKKFTINKYQLKQDELKIYVAALEREYDGKEVITSDSSAAITTWVAGMVEDTLTYTITLGGATTTSKLKIASVKKTNETQAFINVGEYALQVQVSGYKDDNYKLGDGVYYNLYRQADQNAGVFQIMPKKITLETETVVEKNFDGTVNYLFYAGVAGEQVLLGNTAIAGEYARAGVHTLENTTFNVLDVVLDPTAKGFNSTLYNEETKVLDRETAKRNYVVVGATTYKLTINPSNIVVAERRYDYDKKTAEIEVAITGLADTQFLNNNVDKTNLAGVLKISVNSFASFEVATTDEIVESSIKTTESLDALGYSSYTITFTYRAKGTLDAATYTDRYVFAVAGKESGYSTNLALTSSELADGQMGGAAIATGTAVATAEALATALKANADIYLTGNIYGWDASLLDSVVNYTGTLQGNGYSIQLAGGLNSDKDKTNGGAFIASLGGTIQDVNFKFTSTQTLSATNVGLVVGNMTGNMTNVSLDIINTPTIDGATTIGGLAGIASGSMTNATVIFNASVNNANFGGLVGSATNATLTNVSVRAYNGKTTTGKTLVATQSGCTFNGVIDMIGSALGVSGITNLYTVNTSLTSAKAYGKLELLKDYTDGFIEYYFTTLAKTGDNKHNAYGGKADERDKTMYQTYGTPSGTVLAIETLAPRDRFIWEAYSHNYQTEVKDEGGNVTGHINISLNRYVAMMPVGTIIREKEYEIDGVVTKIEFITSGVTMFCPAIGIRGGQEIAASGSTIVEAVYTGDPITHKVEITVDGITTTVSVTGTEAGYYDNIVKELKGDITTDNINYDTSNRTAIVAKIDDGSNVAGAILIIYPKQTALGDNFSKTYDTTSIGEFTTTVDGKSVTLLGTYVDAQDAQAIEASDVDVASAVSFANTLNPIRNVLVDKDGNYIAQHHKTDAEGKTTFSYTKISVMTTGGVEGNFTTSTDITTLTKNSLMRAIAQLIDYEVATGNDSTLASNATYKSAWVYDVTAIKAADVADGYFDEGQGLFFVPKTINTNAGNFTFTDSGLTIGSLTNIYIGATKPSAFAVLAGTTSNNASILPAELGATYTGNLEQCFRSTSLSTNIELNKGDWVQFNLPTKMTETQKTAFNTFKANASVAVEGSAILAATSGISENGGIYTAVYDENTVYLKLALPSQFSGLSKNGVKGSNYVIKPTAQVLKLRYFFKDTDGKYKLETYKDVLMIGKAVEDSDYHTLDYVMKNNINMKSSLITPFDWGNGIAFEGSIDGQGKALTNYILKGENNVGLFASMGATASVTNLVMGNVMVVATASSGEVTVSAISTTGTVTNVATEARVVTATTGSVNLANAGENFVRVHKQSGRNVTVSTLLNGTPKNDYLRPSDIDTLTKFGNTTSERVTNFLNNYVFNNAKLTYNYNSTAGTLSVNVNNFREYWGWYNICPWLEGLNADGKTWNGIRPTKTNDTVTETVTPTP